LSSVREVVVSAGHVVERSGLSSGQVHSDGTSIKVRSGLSIELHAVSHISFSIVGIVVVSSQESSIGKAVAWILV